MPNVYWRKLFYNNIARPRAKFYLLMGCLGKLFTKDRLLKFGLSNDGRCCFCGDLEFIDYFVF